MSNINIKNVKLTRKSGFKQSYYKPLHPEKYIGDTLSIMCRSSWERKVCIYFDTNPNVIKWSSENFSVKYFNILDKKYHTYFPDFYAKIKKGEVYKEYVIEVKPSAQLKRPKKPKINNKKSIENYKKWMKIFVMNLCKIDALRKFASNNGYEVMLLTEKTWFI